MTSDPDPHEVVDALLGAHGRTYASQARIRLSRNTPSPLFELLCLSLLISARISADAAVSAARALWDAGWTTPPKMLDTTWEDRTKVLNESGYARYDESTSRYLSDTAETVLDRWSGDLRELREDADGDSEVLREGLTACKGVGNVGADVFIREVQAVWPEYMPFVDERSLDSARALGLPSESSELASLVDSDPGAFTRLVAALVRVGLSGDPDAVLESAREAEDDDRAGG